MTWEEAADEYAAAINDRDYTNPEVIKRAEEAKKNLLSFSQNGIIPLAIHMRIKEYLKNGKPSGKRS